MASEFYFDFGMDFMVIEKSESMTQNIFYQFRNIRDKSIIA